MKVIKRTLPYKPKGIQWDFFNLDTRFIIGVIGRQWGKSMIVMLKSFMRSSKEQGIYWWIEPTIAQAKIHMKRFRKYFKHSIIRVNLSDREIELDNGSTWFFKNGSDPENLEGETLDGVVLDEAAKMKSEVWYGTIRPMLSVKQGWAIFIGKPRGNNYYKAIWRKAENHPDWSRFHSSSDQGPFFSQEEYDEAKRDTPDLIFRQEYKAEFVDSEGVVFRNVGDLIRGELSNPVSGGKYFAGVDLAKTTDYTVIIILNDKRHVVAFERFNNIPYNLQKERIIKICKRYNAQILMDSTGVGDPIYDDLSRSELKVIGYKFDNMSKRRLIESLVLDFESESISFPEIPELIDELQNFEVEQTKSGLIRYSAPEGQHDDCVIALALASFYCIGIRGSLIASQGERDTAKMRY